MAVRVLVLHGPNLSLLEGPELSLEVIDARLEARAKALGVEVRVVQSNGEAGLLDALVANRSWLQAVIVNPAALAPAAFPLAEALQLLGVPAIEVQLGVPGKWKSALKKVVRGQVYGKGADGYLEALEALAPEAAVKAAPPREASVALAKKARAGEPEPKREVVRPVPPRTLGRGERPEAPQKAPVQKTLGRGDRVDDAEKAPAQKTLGRAGRGAPAEAAEPPAEKTLGPRPTVPYSFAPPPRTLGRRPGAPDPAKERGEPHGVLTRARVREQIAERLAGKLTPAALSTWARARYQDLQAGRGVESGQRDRLEEVLQTLVVAASSRATDQQLIELMVQLER